MNKYQVGKYHKRRDVWVFKTIVLAPTFHKAAKLLWQEAGIYGKNNAGCMKGQRAYRMLGGLTLVVRLTDTPEEPSLVYVPPVRPAPVAYPRPKRLCVLPPTERPE